MQPRKVETRGQQAVYVYAVPVWSAICESPVPAAQRTKSSIYEVRLQVTAGRYAVVHPLTQ